MERVFSRLIDFIDTNVLGKIWHRFDNHVYGRVRERSMDRIYIRVDLTTFGSLGDSLKEKIDA